MEQENKETEICSVWINWEKRIISFEKAVGFEKLEYASHDEMFEFVVKKGLAGFGIQ